MTQHRAKTPMDALAALDTIAYPNRATEDATRRDVTRRVNEKVAAHEVLLANQAQDFRSKAHARKQGADALAGELGALRDEIRRGGLTSERRDRWVHLDGQVRQLVASGLALVETAEPLATKAGDPLTALQALYERFPALAGRTDFGI